MGSNGGPTQTHVPVVGSPAINAGSNTAAAALSTDQRGDARLQGRLKALLPEVDAASRTVTAVLELEDETVPFGAVVELELNYRVPADGYWLPLTALTESDRGLWGAYVVNGDSNAERRLVEILHMEADRAYVRGTLTSGERVIDTGVQRIVPGQAVSMGGGD